MSLTSWKKEFYPVDAMCVDQGDALDHSIRKYEGYSKKNLEKHEVEAARGPTVAVIHDRLSIFPTDAGTCALCFWYAERSNCEKCPLAIVRGGVRCDAVEPYEAVPPYQSWADDGDPRPMLKWLRKAKKMVEKKA